MWWKKKTKSVKSRDPENDEMFQKISKCSVRGNQKYGRAMKLTSLYWVLNPFIDQARLDIYHELIDASLSNTPDTWKADPNREMEFDITWTDFQARIFQDVGTLQHRVEKSGTFRISDNEENDLRLLCALMALSFDEDDKDTISRFAAAAYSDLGVVRYAIEQMQELHKAR